MIIIERATPESGVLSVYRWPSCLVLERAVPLRYHQFCSWWAQQGRQPYMQNRGFQWPWRLCKTTCRGWYLAIYYLKNVISWLMILTKIRTVADRGCDSSSKEKGVVEVPVICTVLFQRQVVVDPELSSTLHHFSNCFTFYTLSNRLFDSSKLQMELSEWL